MGTAPPTVPDGPGGSVARGAPATLVFRLLAGTACVALVVAPSVFLFPFVASKVWFLRPLAWAMAAVLAAEALRGGARTRPEPVSCAGLLFLLSAALSTFAGADPERGLWDTGERMIGLVTYAAVAVGYVAALRVGRTPAAWTVLFRVALAVACLVAVGAVAEMSGVLGERPDRAASTLGSAAYLGPFGVHAAFLGLLVLARRPGAGDRWLAAAAVLAGLVSLTLSQARAPVVGLALGGAYLVLRAAVDGTPRVRRGALLLTAALLALGVALFAFRDAPALQSVPLVRRLATWSPADPTTSTRLLAWDVALDAARDRPLLGWGLNAFPHAFAAHYRPEFLRFGEHEIHFDDAHGALFTTLAEQGVLGVAALAGLFVAALAALRRARTAGTLSPFASAAAGAWILGHAGNLLFSFEDVTSLACLALLLAWCETAGRDTASASQESPGAATVAATGLATGGATRGRRAAAALFAACAAAWTVVADVRPALANARARQALELVPRDARAAVARIDASLALGSPHAETDAKLFAWSVQRTLGRLLAAGRKDEADLLGRRAFDALGSARPERAPADVQVVLLRSALAEATPSLRDDSAPQDAVRAELSAAIAAAPRRQDLRFALAALEVRRGRFREAAEQVEVVVRDDPQSSWGWTRLAVVYRLAGREDEARRLVREARERGVVFRDDDRALLGPLAE